MSNQEFTGREPGLGGLGELDEQIARERGDLRMRRPTPPSPIGDVIYQNTEAAKPRTPGTLPYSSNVIATFDSRFINGVDFSYTAFPQWNITGAPPTALTLQTQYAVPGGYNAVVRNYRFEMEPAVPITYNDLFVDWFVDGVAIFSMQNLQHGQTVTEWIPCFFIAGAGQIVTMQFRAPTGIASNPVDVRNIIVEWTGNLIQDTGVPLPFTVGNQRFGLPQEYRQALQKGEV